MKEKRELKGLIKDLTYKKNSMKQGTEGVDRRFAAEALGRIGDAIDIEPLTVALRDDYAEVRKAAVKALESLNQTVVDFVDDTMEGKLERLVNKLIWIGRNEEFMSVEEGGKYDEGGRHLRTREIGENNNTTGGMTLM